MTVFSDDDVPGGDTTEAAGQGRPVRRCLPAVRSYLLVFEGESCSVFPLPKTGVVTIGRDATSDLRLSHRTVSREHARFVVETNRATVTDLGSSNGSTLNGAPFTGEAEIAAGDTIGVGDVTLVFEPARDSATRVIQPNPRPAAAPTCLLMGRHSIWVADPQMVKLYDLVKRLAVSDVPVLIEGETGTGKELVANALHVSSRRHAGPFVAFNAAAIQDTLIESELFGYERGAFTGAAAAKAGLLESADGGTLFLDEVGELSPVAQAKLLRAIDTKRVTRVGGTTVRTIDVRFVAATNRDLAREVQKGAFRKDLYFRLRGARLWIPPLRTRPAEIPLLAEAFLGEAADAAKVTPKVLSSEAVRGLEGHTWPGNVRELRRFAEYVTAVGTGDVVDGAMVAAWRDETREVDRGLEDEGDGVRFDERDVEDNAQGSIPTMRVGAISKELRQIERERMVAALKASGGNQTRAAQAIGMPRRTFALKVKQYDLVGVGKR